MVDYCSQLRFAPPENFAELFGGGRANRTKVQSGQLQSRLRFLDPSGLIRQIWKVTRHEVENCNRIAIIDNGQIVAIDTPANLKERVGGDIITLRTSDNELASKRINEVHGVETRSGPEGQLIVEIDRGDQFIPKIIETFSNGSKPIEVQSVSLRQPTLEDVFIKLTGHAIREEEADSKSQMRQRGRMFGRFGRRS